MRYELCRHVRLPPSLAERARAVWHSDLEGPISNASDFARALNCDVARVAKTILLVARTLTWQRRRIIDEPCVCVVIPSPAQVDVASVSQLLSAVDLRLATIYEIQALLGVQPGAVSPFASRNMPVLVDEGLLVHETVFVSGGKPGLDLEMPNLVGLQREIAEEIVQLLELNLGNVAILDADTAPSGEVVAQYPTPGSLVEQGIPVQLTVSRGYVPISVPNLTNSNVPSLPAPGRNHAHL